jgi:hypothetical protein
MPHAFLSGAIALATLCAPTPPVAARTLDDAVAYCRAVGTVDAPDRRYRGPPLPAWIAHELRVADDAWVAWRCAGGRVLACVYAAHRRCDAKARTSRRAGAEVRAYCHAHPDAAFVPSFIAGDDDAVSWRCRGRRALAWRVDAVDAQGYRIRDWQALTPPAP